MKHANNGLLWLLYKSINVFNTSMWSDVLNPCLNPIWHLFIILSGRRHWEEKQPRSPWIISRWIACVPFITDLGVTVPNDLSWSKHIESIAAKAKKTLGLVKRVCKELPDLKVRKLLYCALVRPKLEYASSLWSPYT